MDYDDAVTLVNNLGQEDCWAVYYAPHGAEHTLDDGTSFWISENWGCTYVHICLGEQYASYRVDGEVQTSLEEAL